MLFPLPWHLEYMVVAFAISVDYWLTTNVFLISLNRCNIRRGRIHLTSELASDLWTRLWPLDSPLTPLNSPLTSELASDLWTRLWSLDSPLTSDLWTHLWPLDSPLISELTSDLWTRFWSLDWHLTSPLTSGLTSDLCTHLSPLESPLTSGLISDLWPLNSPLTSGLTSDLWTHLWPAAPAGSSPGHLQGLWVSAAAVFPCRHRGPKYPIPGCPMGIQAKSYCDISCWDKPRSLQALQARQHLFEGEIFPWTTVIF